jgi:hypothetical protein
MAYLLSLDSNRTIIAPMPEEKKAVVRASTRSGKNGLLPVVKLKNVLKRLYLEVAAR